MEKRERAILTFLMVVSIPVLFAIPQVTAYPLTCIGGLIGGIAFVNIPGAETHEEIKQRARPVAHVC